MEWIKCTDRLPEDDSKVIGYFDDDIFFAEYHAIESNKYNIWRKFPEYWELEISHWMPLPKSPENVS